MEHRWYTIREMENITQKSRSTIYRWIDAGRLEIQREGVRVLVRSADGTIDVPSETVENGTGGQVGHHMGQLMERMERNAEMMTQYMAQSLKEIKRLERENGRLSERVDQQKEYIDELTILLQNATSRMDKEETIKLLNDQNNH